jgi:hypothetical protein
VKRLAEEEWGPMVRRKAETFEPVTMGHIRGHGCRDLLVYLQFWPLPSQRNHER